MNEIKQVLKRPVIWAGLYFAGIEDFIKFYTNFTKKLVTFRVLLRLLSIEAGVLGRPYKVVLEK